MAAPALDRFANLCVPDGVYRVDGRITYGVADHVGEYKAAWTSGSKLKKAAHGSGKAVEFRPYQIVPAPDELAN